MKLEIIFFGLIMSYCLFYKKLKISLISVFVFLMVCFGRYNFMILNFNKFSFNIIYLILLTFFTFYLINLGVTTKKNNNKTILICFLLYALLVRIDQFNAFSINFIKYAPIFALIILLIQKNNPLFCVLMFINVCEIYNLIVYIRLMGFVSIFNLDTLFIFIIMSVIVEIGNIIKSLKFKKIKLEMFRL